MYELLRGIQSPDYYGAILCDNLNCWNFIFFTCMILMCNHLLAIVCRIIYILRRTNHEKSFGFRTDCGLAFRCRNCCGGR